MPRLSWGLWVAAVLLVWAPNTQCREFTNDDMRDALMMIIRLVRASDDRLERHEFRDKSVGEQMKKMLVGLDKKHRALEPLKGMISRLDERLSNVETILLQKEERDKANQQKITEAIENIQKSIASLSTSVAENMKTKNNEVDNNLTTNEDNLERRLDGTDGKIDHVRKEIEKIKNSLTRESLRSVCQSMDMNPLTKYITGAEKLLNKYELKLNEYNETAYKTDMSSLNEITLADEAWHNKMGEVMERQEKAIKKIQRILADAEGLWKDLPRATYFRQATNETLEAIRATAEHIKENSEKSISKVTTKLKELGDRLFTTNEDIQSSLTQSNTLTERLYNEVSLNYAALRTEVQTIAKSEVVMLQTADNVIATKKRVEYGVQQILMQMDELVKTQAKNANKTVHERFDGIEGIIVDGQKDALKNLSSKIESEMSQVWRQIGIMHQQLIASQGELSKLVIMSDKYTNSSTNTMHEVKEGVSKIDNKVFEMGDNLNYVLGRLSLVTQEFTQISTGLADALSSLKVDIKNIKEKEVSGPGPHKISSEESTP